MKRTPGHRLAPIVRSLALLALPWLVAPTPARAQGIIEFTRGDNEIWLNFRVLGDVWADLYGLELTYRVRYATLLGEPIVATNVKYDFVSGPGLRPSLSLMRAPGVTPLGSGHVQNGDLVAQIEIWDGDEISVSRSGGDAFWTISYPRSRFEERVTLYDVDFYGHVTGGTGEGIDGLYFNDFDGVYGKTGEWGWNFPGSPSWDRLIPDNVEGEGTGRDRFGRGLEVTSFESAERAREIVREIRERCAPLCEGEYLAKTDLKMDIMPIIMDVAGVSPEFGADFFRSPRTAQVATLVGAIATEDDPARRARRTELAGRAVEAFRGDVDPAVLEYWDRSRVDTDRGTATTRLTQVADQAVCEMQTQGRTAPETLQEYRSLLDRQGSVPERLRSAAGAAEELFTRGRLGTGDVQVTLTWDSESDLDLYVREPGGSAISHSNREGDQGGLLDVDDTNGFGPENIFWPAGSAPIGTYSVWVVRYNGQGGFRVRVLNGGNVSEFTGYVDGSNATQNVATFQFQGRPDALVEQCQPLTGDR